MNRQKNDDASSSMLSEEGPFSSSQEAEEHAEMNPSLLDLFARVETLEQLVQDLYQRLESLSGPPVTMEEINKRIKQFEGQMNDNPSDYVYAYEYILKKQAELFDDFDLIHCR